MRLFQLLLMALALILISPAVSPSVFAQTSEEISEEALQKDREIQQRIRKLFGEIPEFKDTWVTVRAGAVTIRGTVLDLEQVAKAEELASRMDGVVVVSNLLNVETSVEKRITPALERFQDRVLQFVSLLPIIGIGLLVLALVSFVGFAIARLENPWDAITPNRFVANLLRQLVRIAFIILGLVLALDIIGATALLGTILGAAGILGLAVGFAVRDTVENYIASVLLSFRQPFRPRDAVRIGEHEGFVIALTARATVLLTYDGNHVRIPNATVFKGVVTNYSLNPERRFSITLGVETSDLQKAVDIGVRVLRDLSFTLEEPAPDGWVDSVGDSAMNLWFGAWINQNETSLVKARSEAIRKIKQAYDAENIGLPEPIFRLRFDDGAPVAQPSTPAKRKTPSRKKAVGKDDDRTERDVSPDKIIEQKILDEEKRNGDGGLLDAEAPQEME